MSVLLPPAPRPRIHSVSTGVRPPLSISTLARSSANAFLAKGAADDESSDLSTLAADSRVSSTRSSPPPSPAFVPLHPSFVATQLESSRSRLQAMFPVVVSRTVDLWRALRTGGSGKHTTNLFASPMASPRSSTDTEYILPLSASPQKAVFDAAELDVPSRHGALYRLLPFPSVHASLLSVVILFPVSTAVVFLSMSTLPITFAWPRTLSDLAQVERDLNLYFRSGFLPTVHIVGVLAVSAVWKHAWSVPGSVLWNVLAGALFHPLLATLLMTVLTSIGSVLATLLATPLAPILTRLFPRPVELTRAALEGSFSLASKSVRPDGESKSSSVTTATSASSPAWARLSVLRLIGIVPWSALNIACGLTGVSLYDCFLGAFIGTLPWTAVTCQIGDILETVSNASENGLGEGLSKSATVSSVLARPSMISELVFLTILSLAPIVFRDHLRKLVPSSEGTSTVTVESEEYEEKEMTIRSSQREQLGNWDPSQTEGSEEDPVYDEMERRGRRMRRQRWTWQRLSMSIPRWSNLGSPLRSSFPTKVERDGKQ